jgi:hypothetical protein
MKSKCNIPARHVGVQAAYVTDPMAQRAAGSGMRRMKDLQRC